MRFVASSKKVITLTGIGLIVFCVSILFASADASSVSDLLIDPVYAIYKEKDGGDSIHIVFAIVNTSKTDATILTEHLDFSRHGIDETNNSLRCTLSFNRNMKYKKKHLVVSSIHKHCPVTLKPGEAAMINYYHDFSKAINYKGWDADRLKADNIVITYKISSLWANRFDLWQGELHSAPVKFTKRTSNKSIQGTR